MKIESRPGGKDIEAWQLARELTPKVYRLTKKRGFAKDYGLKKQIQDAAGSSMHNIAEGFDSETNPAAAGLFVDSSPISRNMKSTKRSTVNPEL
ncbi:MAG: four helix bundle protein [Desulfobacterales bacterium]|nr:four helix bundle protein [Desulfobacterales bacterium]